MLALLRLAMRADPTYPVAFDLYRHEMTHSGRRRELEAEFPERSRAAGVIAHCRALSIALGSASGLAREREIFATLANIPDPSGCTSGVIAMQSSEASPRDRLARFRELLIRHPEWARARSMYVSLLSSTGRRAEALAFLKQGIRAPQHPVSALDLQLQLVRQHRAMLDSSPARRLEEALAASVARDGAPYLRWMLTQHLARTALQQGTVARFDSLALLQIKIARTSNAPAAEFRSVSERGASLAFTASDPRRALASLNRAVVLADSLASADLRRTAYMDRGRAFSALGRYTLAERDMRQAITFVDATDATWLAEAHHNLGHVHEGQGHWTLAAREMDLYSSYAWQVRTRGAAYMMSLHDAGQVRWKAGWHAAARQSFTRMVEVIDESRSHYLYAGEYYERIGDLARAAEYYRRGARSEDSGDLHLNLAGLTRVYEALGLRDSARAAATLHDKPGAYGVSRLLPTILMSEGRVDEALRLARDDVADMERKGSSRPIATARLQLARLLLEAHRPTDALREALSAESYAASSSLTEERVEAMVVLGLAQLHGRSPVSIVTLRRARELARMAPTAATLRQAEGALGDAQAAFGNEREALAAYDRAATAGDRVTASFDSPVDRARSREQLAAAFDGALRVLASMPDSPSRTNQLLAWSVRRKSAVLSQDGFDRRVTKQLPSIAAMRTALGDSEAVVEYIAIDTALLAIVVTRRSAQVVRLPLSVGATSALSGALRRPLVTVDAGQLDLARAPYDLEIAHRLYAGLFAPIEIALAGITRVILIPDGPVYTVPFNALPVAVPPSGSPAYHGVTYLIDRFTLVLSASSRQPAARVPASGLRAVLVIQGTVAGGDRETAAISGAWPAGRVTALSGRRASEAALRRSSAGQSVLHFAVHARRRRGGSVVIAPRAGSRRRR
jgi:tetratricopeptide (TPR) repeat protein